MTPDCFLECSRYRPENRITGVEAMIFTMSEMYISMQVFPWRDLGHVIYTSMWLLSWFHGLIHGFLFQFQMYFSVLQTTEVHALWHTSTCHHLHWERCVYWSIQTRWISMIFYILMIHPWCSTYPFLLCVCVF